MSEPNGQHRKRPVVSFDDPAVIARLAVAAYLHGDEEAREALEHHDLDTDTLHLFIECAAMVFGDLLNLTNIQSAYYGSRT